MSREHQIDDNQDDLGRSVNNPRNRIGDHATIDQVNKTLRQARQAKPDDKPAKPDRKARQH